MINHHPPTSPPLTQLTNAVGDLSQIVEQFGPKTQIQRFRDGPAFLVQTDGAGHVTLKSRERNRERNRERSGH